MKFEKHILIKYVEEIARLKAMLAVSDALRQDLSDQANEYRRLYEMALKEGAYCPPDVDCSENIVCYDCVDKYFREQLRKEREELC